MRQRAHTTGRAVRAAGQKTADAADAALERADGMREQGRTDDDGVHGTDVGRPPAPADVRLGGPAESRERELARARGEQRAAERADAPGSVGRHADGRTRSATDRGEHGPAGGRAMSARAHRAGDLAFRPLADSVRGYSIFLADPDGVITYWGKGARIMKGWTCEQAEGAHLRLLYPDGGAEDGTAEAHLRVAEESGEYVGEGTRVRADGSTFWAGVTLTALRDDDGTLLGFTKVARDLTANRAATAAERERLVAEEANRAMSQFLTTMSHEIRTPINAVTGYVSLLEEQIGGGTLNDRQRHYLERLRLSSQHLAGLVDQILDLSRLDAGGVRLERTTLRLDRSVSVALALVEPQAAGRGLVLISEVRPDAPPCCGDERRVQQILVNLLANAVKFTDRRDGADGRITVSAGVAEEPPRDALVRGPGPWVWVKVEDTGRGMAPEQLAAIFQPFVQIDSQREGAPKGSGLGLAISRRLARLMGGDLTVESTPGVGSRFFLWLAADSNTPPHCGTDTEPPSGGAR